MDKSSYSFQDLWQVLEFLASREGLATSSFIEGIRHKIREHEQKLTFLSEQLLSLSQADRCELLKKIETSEDSCHPPDCAIQPEAIKFPLKDLLQKDVEAMVKTKPSVIYINNEKFPVRSWKDASLTFTRYLVEHGDLKRENLPFCPNRKSSKAYVNFYPGQPGNSHRGGLFVPICENFYVDIKHNAKYHILNMWWSLENLHLVDRYAVEIEFNDKEI